MYNQTNTGGGLGVVKPWLNLKIHKIIKKTTDIAEYVHFYL
jgi:hypothetical protein